MKKTLIFFCLFTLCFKTSFAAYRNINGAQLLYFGASPTIIANGGGYATESKELDALPLNPVVAADKLYHSVNISYLGGFDDGLNAYSISYSLPTLIGVFSLAHTGYLTPYDIGDFYHSQIIFSKTISTQFKFGFSLNFDYLENATTYPFVINFDISTLYESKQSFDSGFGFGELKFGVLLKHIGFPNVVKNSKGEEGFVKPYELRLGTAFSFLKVNATKTHYKLGLGFDLGASYNNAFNFVANLALKNKFTFTQSVLKSLQINVGTFLPTTSSADMPLGYPDLSIPLTAGIIFKINVDKTILNLNYGFMPEMLNDNLGTLHALSINLEFGKKDFNQPKINLGDDMEGNDLIKPQINLPESF